MTCSLLPVVLPRPGPILVVLWIGQWACSYLSCFGFVAVGLLPSLDLFSGLSCAQKGLFFMYNYFVDRANVSSSDFLISQSCL